MSLPMASLSARPRGAAGDYTLKRRSNFCGRCIGPPSAGRRDHARHTRWITFRRRLLFSDEIGDPGEIRFAGRVLLELSVSSAFAVVAFPIDAALAEPGLLEDLAQLWQRPQPPIVSERAPD